MKQDQIVSLNVGGKYYMTSVSTLTTYPDSMIGSMFSGRFPKVKVTDDNAAGIASALANITSDSYINEEDINTATAILEDIVELELTDESVTADVVSIVNNIIDVFDAENPTASETGTSLVTSLELQLTTLAAAGMNFSSVEPNVGVSTVVISSQNLVSGIGFAAVSTDDHGNEKFDSGDVKPFFEVEIPLNTIAVSIFLPLEIVPIIQNETGEDEIRLIFLVFQDGTLFVSHRLANIGSGLDFTRRVGSHICSASVVGVNNVEGLEYPVKTTFLPTEKTTNNTECVFWDIAPNDSEGLWSNEGCTFNGTKDGRVICLCDHLTAFSILVDFYEPELSTFQEVLTVISMVGCIVSIICLIMTIATFAFIRPKNVAMKRPQKILINLSVSLLLLYLVFIIGIEKTASRNVCIGVAALLHYFVLASVCWMSIEAVNLYLMFVKVFQDNVRYFMLKASLLAYGTPLIIVSVFLGSDVKNYENDTYCFIRPGKVRSFGLMLMVGFIFVFNGVMFSLVMYKLIFGRKISKSSNQPMRKRVMKGIYNGVALSILLGLTWLFGYLAVDRESYSRNVFQALFCVFNSLQGLFIFILFCVRQKDIRDWWKACYIHGGNNYRGGAAPTKIELKTNSQTE
ncbi:adhesion G-protein coupled receptor G6-like [Anneissia japonica]|uniref:adhesion G-protein coupled receptor G6-like n=1 Tax=Anneissia japonica TaxID=1529436 RepID=UPI00142582B4|nr:adhesion G-protein coupled receptor G6-like [Anneissia japonica]